MRGRYTYRLSWKQIVELYRLTLPEEQPETLRESYNVAPTHVMPIIRPAGNGRELLAGWGLVPFWLKADQLGKQPYSTIDARDDRIQTATTYPEPFKKRRCLCARERLVPDGRRSTPRRRGRITSSRQPRPSLSPACGIPGRAMASRRSRPFRSSRSRRRRAQRRITTECRWSFEEPQFEDWMRGPPELAAGMIKPYAGAIDVWEVGRDVGNVRNNRPQLLDRVWPI